ncbi:MAG: hypothetical protein RLZZ11_1570, partial [Cyanobacteriota bacterium]
MPPMDGSARPYRLVVAPAPELAEQ